MIRFALAGLLVVVLVGALATEANALNLNGTVSEQGRYGYAS